MISALQKIVSDPKKEFLLFGETQHPLFLTYAMPLIQAGISVGIISSAIVNSLGLTIKKTAVDGVYTFKYEVSKPSILCFSSGTKNNQKGIIRTFESWQNSFALISAEITAVPNVKGIVMGALPYSLSLFGVMESLQRGQQPLVFPNHEIKHFTQLKLYENYILWTTPLHCTFLVKAVAKKKMQALESVRYLFVGGANFSNRQRKEIQNVFPNAKIYSFYGASETSFVAIKNPSDNGKSVGEICKNVEVAILDKHNQKVPKKSEGTIWVKSNDVFTSYIQKTLETNKLDGFISTKDKGYIGNQKRLFFTGRPDRHVSVSGHIIDLNALESWYKALLNTEALVIASKPNELKENELVLMTTEKRSAEDWKALKKMAYERLGAQGVPKKWVHCDTWPMLANGKTDIKTLMKWL